MSDPVLRLGDIHKSYKGVERPILSGAELSVQPGEVVGLVAPSGAGKSTLLHIAGLLDTADSGAVWLSGSDMASANDRKRTATRRAQVGFVYQFHHLLPEFSAKENILLPQLAAGAPPKMAKAHAEELLEAVGLSERADHRPAALSGGEQQRVAFCRALANKPALLLADEPTGNLDPATSATVFEVLLRLARETGLAALIATHNFDLAGRMDRIVRLEEGKLVDGLTPAGSAIPPRPSLQSPQPG